MIKFKAFGHKNILGTHAKTLEITKDRELTTKGDCIIGVNSDFSFPELKKVLKAKKIKLILEVDGLKEEITAIPNPDFSSSTELVIRKTDFLSERTLAIKADKAVKDLSRDFVEKLKNPDSVLKVFVSTLE